jgi:universal stress protein A
VSIDSVNKTSSKRYTVIVAVDESDAIAPIVDFVINHKWQENTHIRILHAVQPITMDHPMATYPQFMESLEQDARSYAEKLVAKVKSDIQTVIPEYQITTEVVAGQPAEVILDMAKMLEAELIVIGSHGRSGMTRFMLGSVSGAVASHAPCNVMIVKMRKHAKEKKPETRIPATTAQNT